MRCNKMKGACFLSWLRSWHLLGTSLCETFFALTHIMVYHFICLAATPGLCTQSGCGCKTYKLIYHVYIQERSKHEINGQRMVCSAMAPVLTAHASWKKVEKIIYLPLISVLGCNVPKTIVQFEDTLLSGAWTNRVECMLAGPSLMLALLSSLMLALNDPPSNIVAQQLGPLKHACRSVEWQLKLVADEFSEVNLIYKSIMNFQTLHAAVLAIVINALEVLPVVDLRSETL